MMAMGAAGGYEDLGNGLLAGLLTDGGWSWQNSLCMMVFFLFHWPCATTLLTIRKETGSRKWTILAAVLPTAFGVALCLLLRWILL